MFNTLFSVAITTAMLFGTSPWFGSDALAAEDTKDPLIVNVSSSPSSLTPKSEFKLQLNLQLPKDYHAYEDQFKVTILEPSGFVVKTMTLNPLKKWFDKFSKKDRTGVEGNSKMDLTIETPDRFVDDNSKLVFELTYQACSSSFCLFPKSKDISVPVSFMGNQECNADAGKHVCIFYRRIHLFSFAKLVAGSGVSIPSRDRD
jgi:thiol:disulfide interchange protein DsbD